MISWSRILEPSRLLYDGNFLMKRQTQTPLVTAEQINKSESRSLCTVQKVIHDQYVQEWRDQASSLMARGTQKKQPFFFFLCGGGRGRITSAQCNRGAADKEAGKTVMNQATGRLFRRSERWWRRQRCSHYILFLTVAGLCFSWLGYLMGIQPTEQFRWALQGSKSWKFFLRGKFRFQWWLLFLFRIHCSSTSKIGENGGMKG